MPRHDRLPDVAILGGGIVGASLAADLAGRGVTVTLYERSTIAAGASGRNSGAVWHPTDPVLAVLYRESLARYVALPGDLAAELEAGSPDRAFRLGDTPAGILTIGWDEDALRGDAASLAHANPELGATFLAPSEVHALEPGLAPGLAAIRLDIGYPVAPASATRALAALARARGAVIREGEDARVERSVRGVAGIRVGGRVVSAGAVVVTAGPWSPSIVDPTGAWRPIRPSWGVIVELELEAAAPRHVLEEREVESAIGPDGAGDREGAVGFSLVTAAGRSSLGSTFLPTEPDPVAWERRLRDGGSRYLPAIARSPTRGLRACARPVAVDGRPLVGRVPGVERLFMAAGHGPWGISTGPASARHVAALVLGEADPRDAVVRDATDPGRFGAPAP